MFLHTSPNEWYKLISKLESKWSGWDVLGKLSNVQGARDSAPCTIVPSRESNLFFVIQPPIEILLFYSGTTLIKLSKHTNVNWSLISNSSVFMTYLHLTKLRVLRFCNDSSHTNQKMLLTNTTNEFSWNYQIFCCSFYVWMVSWDITIWDQ